MCYGFLCRLLCCAQDPHNQDGLHDKTKTKTAEKKRSPPPDAKSHRDAGHGGDGGPSTASRGVYCRLGVGENFWDPTFTENVVGVGHVCDERSALLWTPDSWGSGSGLKADVFHASYGGDVSLTGVAGAAGAASVVERAPTPEELHETAGQGARKKKRPGGFFKQKGDPRKGASRGVDDHVVSSKDIRGDPEVRFRRSAKAASDVEYPAYGVTGPMKERVPSPGDRKLAQSAQMYHYQHQKQQMIAMEKANGDMKHDASDDESEEDNVEGDYTVYECPGLAPTGEMEVKNPLFRGTDTPQAPAPPDSQAGHQEPPRE